VHGTPVSVLPTTLRRSLLAYLEHLYEADAQAEIGVIGENETAGEQRADGEDGPDPTVALRGQRVSSCPNAKSRCLKQDLQTGLNSSRTYAHLNVLCPINQRRCSLQDPRRTGLFCKPSETLVM